MRQFKITHSITNRQTQSIEKYLQEVNRFELISPEEEVRLSILIAAGNKSALDKLVKANLRFVISVAKQYQGQGLSLEDLINEGNIGLMKAAGNYDHTRGFRFISYAVWWIRQQIVIKIAEHATMVRFPMNKIDLKRKVQKAGTLLEQKLERAATEEELAEELKMARQDVATTLSMSEKHVSLDSPLSEDGDDNMLDVMTNTDAPPTDSRLNSADLKNELERSLKLLNTNQRLTLCWFYGLGTDSPESLEQIGQKLNLTRERVRQIKDKALEKLRASANVTSLRCFLG